MNRPVIGDRVRRIRQQMGLSVRELAAQAGVSKMSIVNLEQGKNFRATTLHKVAIAMGLHVDNLNRETDPDREPFAVHRKESNRWYDLADFDRGPYAEGELGPHKLAAILDAGCQVPLNILTSRLEQGRIKPTVMILVQESETRSHQGEEHVFVLQGRARITIGSVPIDLEEGESVTFWSSEPHSYGPSDTAGPPATILSVRMDGKA